MQMRFWIMGLTTALGMTGCGGGSESGTGTSDTPVAPAIAGVWAGTTAGGLQVRLVVTDQRELLGRVENPAAVPPVVGVVAGTLQLDGSTWTGSSVRGFELQTGVSDLVPFQAPDPPTDPWPALLQLSSLPLANVAIGQQALPQADRAGNYTATLRVSGVLMDATLDWSINGALALVVTGAGAGGCTASGQADALAAPARGMRFALTFSGSGCPMMTGGQPLEGTDFNGVVDAASAGAFALYGSNPGAQLGLLLDATRAP